MGTRIESETRAYSQAAGTGKYDRTSRLLGKYDHVRRLWEDQATATFLQPAIRRLLRSREARSCNLKILDLGCGSGDGFDLVTGIPDPYATLSEPDPRLITDDRLEAYVGLDLNPELLEQAREHHGRHPKVSFVQGDLGNGLPRQVTDAEPFDLYFTSFGTLSHFTDEVSIRLITDIFSHAEDGALFVGDWLGRYSYEWQTLWSRNVSEPYFMDYRISYIYDEEERKDAEVSSFPLRLVGWEEIQRIIETAAGQAGVRLSAVEKFDRSVYVGRHMDTADYNPHAAPLRKRVNSLFEPYVRTELEALRVDYVPRPGFDELNMWFGRYFEACNALIDHTISLLEGFDPGSGICRRVPELPENAPLILRETAHAIHRIVEAAAWEGWDDARANIIEPQLGYGLRALEMTLQKGMGTGHGLVCILEIKK